MKSIIKSIISMLCSMGKSKSVAIKSKTDALKARLVVLSLLKSKKLSLASISHKFHAILGQRGEHDGHGEGKYSKAMVLYNAFTTSSSGHTQLPKSQDYVCDRVGCSYEDDGDDGDDKYPDLTHSLFKDGDDELDMDLGDPNGSVIDLVRNSKEEGEEFKLEDEIDQVADLFIMKFHKRIRLQKLESFKRFQEMLERSA